MQPQQRPVQRRDLEHPVWEVYDLYRSARLNIKYYGCRVAALHTQNTWMEIVLAATTSGSAITALAFWDTAVGRPVWQALLAVSALIAVAKPLLRLTDRIQRFEELVGDYRVLEHELKKIESGVRQRRVYDDELQQRFAAALGRMDQLVKKPGEYRVKERLRARCQNEVMQELPAHAFFVPET